MNTSLQLQSSGLLDLLITKYNNTSFRPLFIVTSFFTIGYHAVDANQYLNTVFVYFIFVYGLFVFSINKLLIELFSLQQIETRQKFLLACISNLLFTCIYFLTTEKIEIFGWYCCSTIHLFPMAIGCFSAWLIIKKQKSKSDFVLLFMGALLIAGSAEHVPASFMASGGIVLLMLVLEKRNNRNIFKEHKTKLTKLYFFGGVLLVFFLLFITNPGVWLHYEGAQNMVRHEGQQNKTQAFDFLKMFAKPAKLIGVFILASTWFLFCGIFNPQEKKINLKYFIVAFMAVAFVTAITSLFAYKSLPVGRIWFITDVALFVVISALSVKFISERKMDKASLFVSCGLLTASMLTFTIRHIPNLLRFSAGHDKIVSYLRQQDSGKVIVLEKFPLPDLSNQVVLSEDPQVGENQLFCKFYNIKAKVSVKK